MRRSSFLRDIRCWVGGMSKRVLRSVMRLGEREMVPEAEFMIHPSISLETLQFPSPARAFLRLTEFFTSPSTTG